MDFSATLAAANSLSVDERLQLIGAVWDGLSAEQPVPQLTEAQKLELDRRVAAHQASPDEALPWEEVKARILARERSNQ
jgi:putative addiction module component (TIGR02574 family)